jgi:RNA 2',3'-cyclic 3'-phosphodiesterase
MSSSGTWPIRLFFAVELPPEVQASLGAWRQPEATAYRWVEPSLLHVTLAFLGEQPESLLPTLSALGGRAAGRVSRFRLRLGAAGSFGPRRAPRVLWVGVDDGRSQLDELHAQLDDELRQAQLPVEDRPFAPHITLARRRDAAPVEPPPRWPPPAVGAATPPSFAVSSLSLMRSQLGRGGAQYTPLERFPLAGGSAS